MNAEKAGQVEALSATGWGPLPIAKATRIPSEEIRRHLGTPAGRASVYKQREKVISMLATSIMEASVAAMDELQNILKDGDCSERLKAAKTILDAAGLIVNAQQKAPEDENDDRAQAGGSLVTIDVSVLSEDTRHRVIRETAIVK